MANNMKLVKNNSKKSPPANNSNYEKCKYNATKFGIFAKHSVMHWENKSDYDNLLKDLIKEYQPNSVTERHLIVELANTMWSKIRLKYAEKASLQAELDSNIGYRVPSTPTTSIFSKKVEYFDIKKVSAISDEGTESELSTLKEHIICCDTAIDILAKTDDYEQGLFVLNIEGQKEWKDGWECYEKGKTFDTPEKLMIWIKELKANYESKIHELKNKNNVKDQVLGSTFLHDKLMDKYIRYENHLDKKFEKTLAMFFKLREIRTNGGLSKSVL
jgi:hypothetical protein